MMTITGEDEIWSEDKLNHHLCASMYAGERSMAEGIVSLIRERAGRYYAAGKDVEAAAFRALAESLDKEVLQPARDKCVEWNSKKEPT
jgi:hypothetical protein